MVLDLDLDLLGLDNQAAVLAHDVDRRRPCALGTGWPLLEHAIETRAQLTPSSANGSQRVSVPGTGLTSFLACWWTP